MANVEGPGTRASELSPGQWLVLHFSVPGCLFVLNAQQLPRLPPVTRTYSFSSEVLRIRFSYIHLSFFSLDSPAFLACFLLPPPLIPVASVLSVGVAATTTNTPLLLLPSLGYHAPALLTLSKSWQEETFLVLWHQRAAQESVSQLKTRIA